MLKQQIEEISKAELQELAGIITETEFKYWGECWAEIGKMPNTCPFEMEVSCQACTAAKGILDAGYQKIDEGSVVWTKAEHEEIMQSLQNTLTNATLLKCIIKQKEEEARQARKETAREIFVEVLDLEQLKVIRDMGWEIVYNTLYNEILKLAKQYGVEIEQL